MVEQTPDNSGNNDLFDEGFEAGQSSVEDELREQLAAQLEDEGFDPGEIEELVFDPRRRGGRHRRGSRRYRTYDPARKRRRSRKRSTAAPTKTYARAAPRRKASRRGGKKKAKMLRTLERWAFPITGGVSFFYLYWMRAKELYGLGLVSSENDIFGAIMYDLKNFNVNDMFTRLVSNVGNYGLPLAGGFIVDNTKILGKYSKAGSQALYGTGAGILGKTILDPKGAAPVKISRGNPRNSTVRVVPTGNSNMNKKPCPGCETMNNPYS